jgi:hypothetical protein
MINRLLLTTNAYFYKVKKPISKAAITRILTLASASKDGHALYNEVRKPLNVGGEDFKVSLVIFKRDVPPTFLVPGKEMEIHFNYLFLVEYDNCLIISKKGAEEFMEVIETKVAFLSYQEVTSLKITSTTQFAKVGVTNMDTTTTAMRRAVYEAQDVKNILSPLSTSNKIVTSLKLTDKVK